jgi:hypothetical protein
MKKDNSIERISIGISLADAELESYYYNKNENYLIIKIKTWDIKIVEFIFFDLISFIDRGGNFIMDFCKSKFENEFFKQTLQKNYDKIPINNPYKLFQFLDVGDEPYLEIICKNFESKILMSE